MLKLLVSRIFTLTLQRFERLSAQFFPPWGIAYMNPHAVHTAQPSVAATASKPNMTVATSPYPINSVANETLDVTVAIPTYNGAARLPMVLDQLRSQINLKGLRWEIIVCDNNSTDDTEEVVRQYQKSWPADIPLYYRFAAEQGAAFARQRAVELAKGDIIAFLDDDNIPAKDWVSQAIEFAQSHPQVGAFGSQIHGKFESELPDELENIKSFLAIIERGDEPQRYEPAKKILPPAAGLVVRKEAWLSAVPERLFLNNKGKSAGLASEDLEAILYIQKAGWEIWYNPDMVVHHDIPDGRLRKDYLVTLLRCVGLSRFHIRMLGTESWKRPFAVPAYIANDIRKLALHRMRHGAAQQLGTVERCQRELLVSSVVSPYFLLGKVFKDGLGNRQQLSNQRQALETLAQAFEQGSFTLYQQPVQPLTAVDAATDNQPTRSTELLLRLRDSTQADESPKLPNDFLPDAKRFGLMRTLDRWVIRRLFIQVAKDAQQPEFEATVAQLQDSPLYSINLSTDSVLDRGTVTAIAKQLTNANQPPSLFCFEVNASTAAKHPKATCQFIAALHQLGCQITLDDATLSPATVQAVQTLSIDYIKLTPGVVESIQSGSEAWNTLKKLLQQQQVKAIAKGIECPTVLEAVKAQGIDYAQGHQIGQPQPF